MERHGLFQVYTGFHRKALFLCLLDIVFVFTGNSTSFYFFDQFTRFNRVGFEEFITISCVIHGLIFFLNKEGSSRSFVRTRNQTGECICCG